MSKLRIAIAGAGYISEYHLKGWSARDDIELVGISDPDMERAEKRAQSFGIPSVFSDTAEMLDNVQPDAIDIITPVETHAQLARLAARRGVHIMCQKPMTPTLEEAEQLVADIGDTVRFMVHENYRFRPHYTDLAKRLTDGVVGSPRQARLVVRSSSLFDFGGKVPFLLDRQPYLKGFERLLVFEVLIHHLDVLRALFGELTVLAAHLDRINPDLAGEDVALVTLQSKNGVVIQIDANISALGAPPLPADRLEILGDKNGLILDRNRIYVASDPEDITYFDLEKNYPVCFSEAISNFVLGLRHGTRFATDRLDNLETLRLMEAIYQIGEPLTQE